MKTAKTVALSIFVLGIVFGACTKSKNTSPDYTANMGGNRKWHIMISEQMNRPVTADSFIYSDTTYFLPDESFAIIVVDANTVSIGNTRYAYNSSDSVAGTLSFVPVSRPYGSITYYYHNDSVVYADQDPGITVSYEYLYYTY